MTGCGRFGQSWVCDFRSNGWQYPAPPRAAAGAGAQAHDHMAGLHSDPLGAAGWKFMTLRRPRLRRSLGIIGRDVRVGEVIAETFVHERAADKFAVSFADAGLA